MINDDATDRELLTVMASMKARPGKEQLLREALEALIEPTQHDEGMVAYHLHQGVEDPALFCFYEKWTNAEALDTHLQAPHLVELGTKVEDLLDGDIVIHRVRRIG
jgi:quinol monooxygenase YgiN